jgi:hypothetical protein
MNTVTLPDGRMFDFPTPEAANAFKQKAGIGGSQTKPTQSTQPTQNKSFMGWMKQGGFLPQITDFGIGALKGVGERVYTANKLMEQGLQKATGGLKKTTGIEQFIDKRQFEASNTAQRAGKVTEEIAEFILPGTTALKIGKAAQLATKGGKIAQTAAKFGAIGATEGVLGTGTAGLQSGKIGQNELLIGGISVFAPAIMAGVSKAVPKSLSSKIIEKINKSIKPSTKSISNPSYPAAATRATQILNKELKATAQTTGRELQEVINDLTVGDTLNYLRSAKQKIYSQYNDIAAKAGDSGVMVNIDDAIVGLEKWINNTGYSRDIKEYALNRLAQLEDLRGATPLKIQDRIEELNSSLNWGDVGNKMKATIDAGVAKKLTMSVDEAILNSLQSPYKQLRSDYAALRTIQDDIERTAANLARKNNKGLYDYTDIYTGSEIIGGLISQNPLNVVRGVGGKLIKDYYKYINSPDKNLRDLFRLIDTLPEPKVNLTPTMKALPEGTPGKTEINTAIPLGARSQSTIDMDEIKRLQSLKGNGAATPKTALGGLEQEATKYKTAEEFVNAQSLYHGTPNELEGGVLKFGAGKQLKKGGYMGGHFLTDTPEIAENFSFGGKVYQASGEIKNKVLDVNKSKKLFQDFVGKKYKTADGELVEFTKQEFDYMFPDGKADWATLNTDLAEQIAKKQGKIGVAIPEYAGGKEGMTYQIFQDNVPVYTKSQLIDIWEKANKK